jgi:hypothetical protein
MTNEQILKLAKSCGIEHWSRNKGECWECLEDELLKFALAIHEDGYNMGYGEGYDEGYEHAGNAYD